MERKETWIRNAGELPGLKNNKVLNKNSYLYEFYFTIDMYEKVHADGKKKLKSSAIPTIFGEFVIQRKEKIAEFVPNTESAIEIVVASELTAQESVLDIESTAKIISNPIQEKEEFFSTTGSFTTGLFYRLNIYQY